MAKTIEVACHYRILMSAAIGNPLLSIKIVPHCQLQLSRRSAVGGRSSFLTLRELARMELATSWLPACSWLN